MLEELERSEWKLTTRDLLPLGFWNESVPLSPPSHSSRFAESFNHITVARTGKPMMKDRSNIVSKTTSRGIAPTEYSQHNIQDETHSKNAYDKNIQLAEELNQCPSLLLRRKYAFFSLLLFTGCCRDTIGAAFLCVWRMAEWRRTTLPRSTWKRKSFRKIQKWVRAVRRSPL